MIGLTADAGDNFKNRAPIPLAPCISEQNYEISFTGDSYFQIRTTNMVP
jgi:hypothetical protein